MLRQVVIKTLRDHFGTFSLIFAAVGWFLFCILPVMKSNNYRIDENAIELITPVEGLQVSDEAWNDKVIWHHRLVRGLRSPGSEVIAVYANTEQPASIALANKLIQSLRRRHDLSCDVEFFFVNYSLPNWPLPSAYVRAAFVLNISSLFNKHLCYEIYGENAMQPNQDLVTAAMRETGRNYIDISLSCTSGWTELQHIPSWLSRNIYLRSLLEAIITSTKTHRWQSLPAKTINSLAISSNTDIEWETSWQQSEPDDEDKTKVWLAEKLLEAVLSLNGLEERFHHSTYVWMPVDKYHYVEFDSLQFSTVCFICAIISIAYRSYQENGIDLTWRTLCVFIVTNVCAKMSDERIFYNMYEMSWIITFVSIYFMYKYVNSCTTCTLASLNAAILSVMLVTHPPLALVGGGLISIEMLFWHPRVHKSLLLSAGGVVYAWGVYYLFHTTVMLASESFYSLPYIVEVDMLLLNALWISNRQVHAMSRFLCK